MALQDQLRQAVKESELSLYAIAKGAGIAYPVPYRFSNGRTGFDVGNGFSTGGFLQHATHAAPNGRRRREGSDVKAWLFQDTRQKEKLGDKCPWSVGWFDPDGKKKSKRIGCQSRAERFARKIEGQLAAGTYQGDGRKTWQKAREDYQEKILPRLAVRTRTSVRIALDNFERLAKPGKLLAIKTQTIDNYIMKRSAEGGKKPDSRISPATVNRELRHVKAFLRVVHDWGYLPAVPKIRMVREQEKIGSVMTPEHFQAIYAVCDVAVRPEGLARPACEWWCALLTFLLTTGWRIEEALAFRREDLDLETGRIITRAANNKGRRDDADYLPGVVLGLVRAVVGFSPLVFPWPHHARALWEEFQQIQKAAGVNLPCPQASEHTCTDACHYYGFHSIRRGYATLNADSLPAPVLQRKMRHKSFTTTLRYISLANKMKQGSERVFVPEFLKVNTG